MNHLIKSIKGSFNVITGCGSGLGKATLERFLREGSGPILAIDRYYKPDFLESLDITDEQRSLIVFGVHDTFDEQKTVESLNSFVANHGPIDHLINIAGTSLAFSFFKENSDPEKIKVYDLRHAHDLINFNTVGTFNLIRLTAQHMVDRDNLGDRSNSASSRSKCIVNTSCISTTKPSHGQTFYTGSKSSIDSMTLCIAREFAHLNIRCNTINVGYFDTPLLQTSDVRVCDYIAKEKTLCPKRLGDPAEFAHLVQSIIENEMLNGACIKIDAGAEAAQEMQASRVSGR